MAKYSKRLIFALTFLQWLNTFWGEFCDIFALQSSDKIYWSYKPYNAHLERDLHIIFVQSNHMNAVETVVMVLNVPIRHVVSSLRINLIIFFILFKLLFNFLCSEFPTFIRRPYRLKLLLSLIYEATKVYIIMWVPANVNLLRV